MLRDRIPTLPRYRIQTSSMDPPMPPRDPRVDAYIARARDFARPILEHLRKVIHANAPDATEAIKWGHPFFVGRGPICHMAAFNRHVALGFWKHRLAFPKVPNGDEAMGAFGRITKVGDLPSVAVLGALVRQAVELDATGVKAPRASKPKPAIATPPALKAALAKAPRARSHFERMSPSHRREYAEWIASAKQEATRARRVATAIEWLSEGRSQNWRYETPRPSAAKPVATRRPAAKQRALATGVKRKPTRAR